MKRFFAWICCVLLSASLLMGCAATHPNKLSNDAVRRNEQLREDLSYYMRVFPKRHKNPFTILTREAFETRMNDLIARVDTLDNEHVFTELKKIVAAVGDAHSGLKYDDALRFPLEFYLFADGVYIINAPKNLESLLYARVTAIDGMPISEVLGRLGELVSHENESWLNYCLGQYLSIPIHLYGTDVITSETEAVFTTEKDGVSTDTAVLSVNTEEMPELCVQRTSDVFTGKYDELYSYQYLPESKALYFAYNECTDWAEHRFEDFNREMFETAAANGAERIVLDLRCNSGGNSEVLNPFTDELKNYLKEHAGVKVFILVSRNTFSSGIFAIYRTMEAAPNAVSVGECSGGSPDAFGEVKRGYLPNSGVLFTYSIKYFEFSKNFTYKNTGDHTFLPDVLLAPSMEDYVTGNDVVLNYALAN